MRALAADPESALLAAERLAKEQLEYYNYPGEDPLKIHGLDKARLLLTKNPHREVHIEVKDKRHQSYGCAWIYILPKVMETLTRDDVPGTNEDVELTQHTVDGSTIMLAASEQFALFADAPGNSGPSVTANTHNIVESTLKKLNMTPQEVFVHNRMGTYSYDVYEDEFGPVAAPDNPFVNTALDLLS